MLRSGLWLAVVPLRPGLNAALNDCARNTDDVTSLRDLVRRGADLKSTNGAPWHHTLKI